MMIYAILFMVIGSYPDTISYRAVFADSQLTFETIQDFDLVTLDNAQHIRNCGYPALPCKTYLFVIPAGSRIANVDYAILDSSSIDGTYEIWPAQHSIPISWDDSIPATDPDSAIYGLAFNWPDRVAQGSQIGEIDVTELARVDVFPVAWNPQTGRLTLREEIDIDIILTADTLPAPSPVTMTHRFWDRRLEWLSDLVENDDDIATYSTASNLVDENSRDTDGVPDAVDCMILTRDAWADSWQPLVDWNIKRGLYTEVLTLEEISIRAGVDWDAGEDWLETIRNCIRWQHAQKGVHYFLLGTDATDYSEGSPSENEVPMRYCELYVWLPGEFNHADTDWYYACLSPLWDWQTNDNPDWGEYHPSDPAQNDWMDMLPEVAVGRIPVHNSLEAHDAAVQSVAYQRHEHGSADPGADLLVVSANVERNQENVEFPMTWEHLQEIVSVVPSYISRQWLAEEGNQIPEADPISPTAVRECLDGTTAGSGYYRANFGGHGGAEWIAANATGMPGSDKVYDDDLRGLGGDDGMYCTGHAFNCLTGRFITPDPDVPVSIAETWVGADLNLDEAPLGPAYTGNSIGGLDYPEPGASSSHKLNRWILEGLYSGGPAEGGAWGIGDVLCHAKTIYSRDYLGDAYPTQIPDPIEIGDEAWEPMWDLKGCNLAGDPAMPIWVREPWGWTSIYPSTVECPAQFTIQVETGGGVALEGVRVCLMMRSQRGFEIYERGFTDASGEYSTRLEPSFSGTMFVTLTKQGYMPDEGEVSLLVD